MEAKNLMIGDWVLERKDSLKGGIHYIPVKVKSSDFTDVGFFEKCNPVPITQEILEKNRFNRRLNHGTGATEETIEWFVNKFCFREFLEDWRHHKFAIPGTSIEFRYVHELQHALCLCGLTELANTFKVD